MFGIGGGGDLTDDVALTENRVWCGGLRKWKEEEEEELMAVEYRCCEPDFFIHILIIVGLVLFAGLMSGLTLGLMSMSLVDLEVLAKSGTPRDRKHAGNLPFFFFFFVPWY